MKARWTDYTYEPRPLTARPATRTPYDQTQARPTTSKGTGKLGGVFPKVSGGEMNSGGKRRSGRKP